MLAISIWTWFTASRHLSPQRARPRLPALEALHGLLPESQEHHPRSRLPAKHRKRLIPRALPRKIVPPIRPTRWSTRYRRILFGLSRRRATTRGVFLLARSFRNRVCGFAAFLPRLMSRIARAVCWSVGNL